MSVTRPCQRQPGIQKRRVVIENSHGEKLVGMLHDTGSKGLVVFCHGLHSSKERIPMVNLAAALEEQGTSAFRFDFAGNGESEGSFRYGNYHREADDLRAVVRHFLGCHYVITAIVGHSKGGNAVILYGAKYKDVPVVVNISGRFNLERGIEGRLGKDYLQRIKKDGFIDVKNKRGTFQYRATQESLLERLAVDMHAACQSIDQNCRVLTVHGSMDKTVPVEDAYEYNKFIPNHKLYIVEGADHEFTSHQNELASIVLGFIKKEFHQEKFMLKHSSLGTRVADKSIHSRM
ncbi:PREDICTED: uncharacterized protein LOC101311344 [Fragaria vesca subsp. vesca]|uniref:uncharacterized protein LOC101311344 n=1 Tax=Fragaria vesca subsp. vesca TaxID=101020 RepID=UPI0002C34CC5|nr:PREDICTED: uncharacterized protein LOC101311344 [Fragaria vesca subsp. vesca]